MANWLNRKLEEFGLPRAEHLMMYLFFGGLFAGCAVIIAAKAVG